MVRLIYGLFALFIFFSCATNPKGLFNQAQIPEPPDYSKSENWAALPQKEDLADRTPSIELIDNQENAQVDVFFLHPTTYTKASENRAWNASLSDVALNKKTDKTTILFQASIFNGAGKIYAPRYRQTHLHSFYTKKYKAAADKSYKLAYQDLKAAFEYYLENYNNGRPVIIASHSQGAGHGIQLLKDFFDGKPLQEQLVAAYLVGWPVKSDEFENIKVCESPTEISCFCSWRSFKNGYLPKHFYESNNNIAVTNPLTWTTEKTYVSKSLNEGAILRDFEKIYPELADAQVHNGILWVNKPKFSGSFLITNRNYHIADLNFYYLNVRNNAIKRAATYLETR